jgi:leucyl aminopeptidase
MKVAIIRTAPESVSADTLALLLMPGARVPRHLSGLDQALGHPLRAHLAAGFEAKRGQTLSIPARGIAAGHMLVVGIGDAPDEETLREAAGTAVQQAAQAGRARVALLVPRPRRLSLETVGQALAEGAMLGSYRFDKYRTLQKPATPVQRLTLLAAADEDVAELRAGVAAGTAIGESVTFARDLSNEPGSVNTPAEMANQVRRMARIVGLRSQIFTEAQLERAGMGGILAVGRGSEHPPRLIVLEHGAPRAGAKRGRRRPTVALVGKGITFDTGGISIKPAANMHEMKGDMSGGAAVIGAMRAAAVLDLPLHLIGVVPAAENKPDGAAYMPGDIVRTAKGTTIEILNTDAEGRVVLADGLYYAAQQKPDAIIDVATLTGAKVVALGTHCCAVMGNDETLIERVRAAGERTRERAWPLPLWDEYKSQIRGDVGDLKNTGGRDGGSITAAALLSHFVEEIPWAHLDIAGNEQTTRDTPSGPRGATGFGVRLLIELLRTWA